MSLLKDNHVYSYSQLSSFDECPYSFYLQRIEKISDIASNAFAERGTLIHDLLDQWAKGKLDKHGMAEQYEQRYSNEVVTAFPSMMKEYAAKAYYDGKMFIENFDEFAGYKVESAEEKFTIDLPLTDGTSRKFTGIVDLILRKEWTNELIVCDHKSKSMQAFKKSEKEMYRQQLLYAQYVYEKYGEYPKICMFHLFNECGQKPEKPFDLKDFREALSWASDCIYKIEDYTVLDWLSYKDSSDFYCMNLCSTRNACPKHLEKPKTKKELAEEKRKKEDEEFVAQFMAETNEAVAEEKTSETKEAVIEDVLLCEYCGAPVIPGKRKCAGCGAWYKKRIKT